MRSAGITEAIREHLRSKIRVRPVHVNRASEIGHPCLRYLTYARIAWDQRQVHGPRKELLFRMGRYVEDDTVDLLRESGFQVVEQQRDFHDEEAQITGHIDGGVLLKPDQIERLGLEVEEYVAPIEIKGLAGATWQRLVGADDIMDEMRNSQQPWLRKYPGQITCYMGMQRAAKPLGVFILKNKWSGDLEDVAVDFDEEYFEAMRARAQAVNFHVEARILPGRTDEYRLCEMCDFAHICLDEGGGSGEFPEEDPELGQLLDRRAFLKKLKEETAFLHELSDLDAEIKARVQGRERVLAGNWIVTGKEINVKERRTKAYSYWRPSYKRISKESQG